MNKGIQLIASTRPDDGVSLTSLIIGAPVGAFSTDAALENGFTLSEDGERWERSITDESVETELSRAGVEYVSWRRVDEVPADRTFRNAWVDTGKAISVDMLKALTIAHTMRRGLREEEMAPLDKQINIDIAVPAKVAATEQRRQAIRDKYAEMQATIDSAKSPDELLAVLSDYGAR